MSRQRIKPDANATSLKAGSSAGRRSTARLTKGTKAACEGHRYLKGRQVARAWNWHGAAHRKGACLKEVAPFFVLVSLWGDCESLRAVAAGLQERDIPAPL